MKSLLLTRALPFGLLLVATVVATMAAVMLVYSKGIVFMAGPVGLLLQVPILLVLALVTHVVLTRVKKLPRDAQGFTFDARAGKELAASTLAGFGILALAALALWAAGLVPFAPSSTPPSALVLAIALLSSLVNAALQQVPLQSFAQAMGTGQRPSPIAAGISVLLFTLSHAHAHATPLYLFNVFLFGAITARLFYRGTKPSYAAPVGFHGGWNLAYVFVLSSPTEGSSGSIGLLRWPDGESLLWGGTLGFEAGLANTVVVSLVLVALVLTRGR